MATLEWRGKQVAAKMAAAAKLGVDKTMSECVSDARRNHPWVSQTGFEEASITMTGAHADGLRVSGRWGAYADYSLYLEIGTSRVGPTAGQRENEGEMWSIPGPQPAEGVSVRQPFTILPPGTMADQETFVTLHRPSIGTGPLMGARPFLRPAADTNYPLLRTYIRAAFAGQAL